MMSAPNRSVATETLTVTEIVHKLKRNHFLIPTFQRDFVWKPADVLALWDSMYRAFPIGSILCWNTTEQLETHRRIGGFALEPDPLDLPDLMEYRYILDGQQRLTSLFISYVAGREIVEDEPFDFGLYFDPTASDDPGTDWKDGVFVFANDVGKRREELRRKGVAPELIIRVGDETALDADRLAAYAALPGYTPEARIKLIHLYRLLQQYRIPFIFTQGVRLGDVCDIYERINQKGRKLSTADIVVARTFRTGAHDFNLRGMFDDVRASLSARASHWRQVDQQLLLQMIGVCLRVEHTRSGRGGRNPYGIDKSALLNLTPEVIQPHWEQIRRAIVATIEFLVAQGVFGRNRLPAAYLPLPLCACLYLEPEPDERQMRQWFWRSSFDYASIDSDADVYAAINTIFEPLRAGRQPTLKGLTLNIRSLTRHYPHDSSFRNATLAFLSSLGPRDLADGHIITDSPGFTPAGSDATLHHICPRALLTKLHASSQTTHRDSLMNLCWMSQKTNFDIGDTSPAIYFDRFRDKLAETQKEMPEEQPEKKLTFEDILASQLIPLDFASRKAFQRADYRPFLLDRARLFATRLRAALPDVPITIVDR